MSKRRSNPAGPHLAARLLIATAAFASASCDREVQVSGGGERKIVLADPVGSLEGIDGSVICAAQQYQAADVLETQKSSAATVMRKQGDIYLERASGDPERNKAIAARLSRSADRIGMPCLPPDDLFREAVRRAGHKG